MLDLTKYQRLSQLDISYRRQSGVYAHIYSNELAYIGCSVNLANRQSKHKHDFFDTGNRNPYYSRIKFSGKEDLFLEQLNDPLVLECNPPNPSQSESDFIALFLKNDWTLYNTNINTNRQHASELRCWKCKEFKPRNQFSKSKWNKTCKSCQSSYYSMWYRNRFRRRQY